MTPLGIELSSMEKHPIYKALEGKKFVLASTSPRRLEILNALGFKNVIVCPSNFPEDLNKEDYTPSEYVRHTALGKAMAVWEEQDADLVLAADTVVEAKGEIYEKPKDKTHQAQCIKRLRDCGESLNCLSGVVLIRKDQTEPKGYRMSSFVESTKIYMDTENLTDELIDLYCEGDEGSSVAAGFRIQGYGAIMIKSIEGDYMNVVGLPLRSTFREIEKVVGVEL